MLMVLVSGCTLYEYRDELEKEVEDLQIEIARIDKEYGDYLVNGSLTILGNVSWMESINYSSCANYSEAPLEQFCNDNNMEFFQSKRLFRDSGCIDELGELHYYKISFNRTTDTWLIGGESYSPDWSC